MPEKDIEQERSQLTIFAILTVEAAAKINDQDFLSKERSLLDEDALHPGVEPLPFFAEDIFYPDVGYLDRGSAVQRGKELVKTAGWVRFFIAKITCPELSCDGEIGPTTIGKELARKINTSFSSYELEEVCMNPHSDCGPGKRL